MLVCPNICRFSIVPDIRAGLFLYEAGCLSHLGIDYLKPFDSVTVVRPRIYMTTAK